MRRNDLSKLIVTKTNVTTIKDNSVTDNNHGEQANNKFQYPIKAYKGLTGSIFEADGVVYV